MPVLARHLHRYTIKRARIPVARDPGLPLPGLLPDDALGASLVDANDVGRVIRGELARLPDDREHFFCLHITIRNDIIGIELVATGSLTQVEVHPRECFRGAIMNGAAGIIVAHNHPSGDPTPSPEDLALTRRLREVGVLIGIPLVDHIIVAERGIRSLAEWIATS